MSDYLPALLGLSAKELEAIERCMLTTGDVSRLTGRSELEEAYVVVRDVLNRAREFKAQSMLRQLQEVLGT